MQKYDLEYFKLIKSKSTRYRRGLKIYDIISGHLVFEQGEKGLIFTGIGIDICTYRSFIHRSYTIHHRKYLKR